MFEGKNIRLRVMEKEDLPLFAEWLNNPEFLGEYNPLRQMSKIEIEKNYDERKLEQAEFFIEKKVGGKIGYIFHFIVVHPAGKLLEIGYFLAPAKEAKATAQKLSKLWSTTCFYRGTQCVFKPQLTREI